MKVAVVGPGALGCLVAGSLKNKTKEDVWLLDKLEERAGHIRNNSVKVEGLSGQFSVKPGVSSDAGKIGRCDLVIICVKSYATEDSCRAIKEMVGDKTCVLTLQNGIGNVQILDEYFGKDRVVAGVTSHGSTHLGIGHVRHAGKGDTVIGKYDGRMSGTLKSIAGLLTKAGFETRVSRDINSVIWGKLIINVGINALTAITRLNNGRIIEYEELRELMRGAVQEAVKVVKRKRIKLPYDDPIQKAESVARATAANISSMLQDVLSKRRTEIDFINGAIVRQGRSLGIPTPINEVLTGLVKTIESSYDKTVNK